jgi:hypothetical protein
MRNQKSPTHYLVKDGIYFKEIEDQVQFANVSEINIENLHKKVNCLQVCEFVVILIYDEAEEES